MPALKADPCTVHAHQDILGGDAAPCVIATLDRDESPDAGQDIPPETCYLCMDRAADAVLVECGHGGLCVVCADALWRRGTRAPGGRSCPLCRRPFIGVMHILSETNNTVRRHLPSLFHFVPSAFGLSYHTLRRRGNCHSRAPVDPSLTGPALALRRP